MKIKVGMAEKTITVKTARDIAAATKNDLLQTVTFDVATSADHALLIKQLARQTRPYVAGIISPK